MAKLYWENFSAGQVLQFGSTLVTAQEIKAFAAEFDPQPMHLDEMAASATLVGGLCASGWHTGCMMMRMVADGFVLNSSSLGATGIEEMRWLAPVRPGDRLSVRVTVLETTESKSRPERGFVRARFEVFTATGICVLTAVANLIFGRRLGAARARAAQAIEQP
ncbi:MAG TPA: MaoC family dehydratase [Xanthobacteraceae bacterium]